jgi:CDP-glucose 4,6-dehydratase
MPSRRVVFHLAAQPWCGRAIATRWALWPPMSWERRNVLEAVRAVHTVRALVLITTDKVYESREGAYPYREIDPLGGHDPYSASKAGAEIVAASYRASFFQGQNGSPSQAWRLSGRAM